MSSSQEIATVDRRTPTAGEWREAEAQAGRAVRKHPDIAHEADEIVGQAIVEVLQHFTHGSFAALVTSRAKLRALDRLRELAAEQGAYAELRDEAEEAMEATSLEHDEPEPVDVAAQLAAVTLDQTKAATLAECYRRLGAVGTIIPDTWSAALPDFAVAAFREVSARARAMLALARGTPSLLHHVADLSGLETIAALVMPAGELPRGARRLLYRDAAGIVRRFGTDSTEAAVLAIVGGSWPKVKAGEAPETIIRRKAANIRQAAPKIVSAGRIRTKPKKGKR